MANSNHVNVKVNLKCLLSNGSYDSQYHHLALQGTVLFRRGFFLKTQAVAVTHKLTFSILARAEEQLRLSQERVAAFQQQQRQFLELQRQQQQLDMANQLQHIRNIVPSMNGIDRPPEMIGQMPPRISSMSAEERFRNLQIINLANLRNSIPQLRQWNQPNVRTNFSLPVSRQMNPRNVRIVEVPRHRNPQIHANIRRPPIHRFPHHSNTGTGIRIVRVEGSLPRNSNFRR